MELDLVSADNNHDSDKYQIAGICQWQSSCTGQFLGMNECE